jgi:hypothetical protein
VVCVTGNLEGLDGSSLLRVKGGEHLLEFHRLHFLGDLADEDVAAFVGLGQVASEEGVVKGESTAPLSLDLEVAEYFAGLGELPLVVDAHDGAVERLDGVSTHLRLVLELDAVAFEDLSKSS